MKNDDLTTIVDKAAIRFAWLIGGIAAVAVSSFALGLSIGKGL